MEHVDIRAYFEEEYGRVEQDSRLSEKLSDELRVMYGADSVSEWILAEKLRAHLEHLTGHGIQTVSDDTLPTKGDIVLRKSNSEKYPYFYEQKREDGIVYVCYGSFFAAEKAIETLPAFLKGKEDSYSDTVSDRINIPRHEGEYRIMSSNVLFGIDKNAVLPYEQRAALLAETYRTFLPDFIGLQEAQGGIGDTIMDILGDRYTMVTQSRHRQTPILYCHHDWRIATENGEEIKWVDSFEPNYCWAFEWVMFENLHSAQCVIVGNLHFQPNGLNERCTRNRPLSIANVNRELGRILVEYPDTELFICGDYNMGYENEEYTTLLKDLPMNSGVLCTEDHDEYKKAGHAVGRIAEWGDPWGVDHVVVAEKRTDVVRHRKISCYAVRFASDHYPTYIDVKIKN